MIKDGVIQAFGEKALQNADFWGIKPQKPKNMFKEAKNSRCTEEPLLTKNEDSEEQNIGSESKNVESNPLKRSPLRKLLGKVNET